MKHKSTIGFSLLAVGFLYCFYLHITALNSLSDNGKPTVLIAHWQGERGCKEALQAVIDEYNQLHPETHVRQQIIVGAGSSFTRWCVTQIIGGNPPDIMQYHAGFRSYLGNYFVGLGEYADQPNPYTKGTEHESIPWKDTFYGGMSGNWEPQLMDYYSIPNTMYTKRFYYNKNIFRKATGSDKPPETMEEFIDICQQIETLGIIPVIVENATGVLGVQFMTTILSQIGWSFEHDLDFNHDGMVQPQEFMRGVYVDGFEFSDARLNAGLDLMQRFSRHWGKGFNAIDTTIAPFMFIQGKGACYFGGSWLGRQMLDSCEFDLGSFPFPLVTSDDPVAGDFYCGPWGENTKEPGMALAVSKGPNKHIAIDFLRFLTTRKNNSAFNAGPAWVPGVIGADITPAVRAFQPLIRGKSVGLFDGVRSFQIEYKRIIQNFLGDVYDRETASVELAKNYRKTGRGDNLRAARDSKRRLLKVEEIRNDVDRQRLYAKTPKEKKLLRDRLTKIYETQVYGLNSVYATFGTAAEVEGR
ncbi:MAG: extracellular solute-binding protein [Candidatus Pacebacteria bacterium]|nr:extracellular solute-binding protein [Candidatus Paceibacterota bacterium]